MEDSYRQRQLARIEAAIAQCDKQHTPEEIEAAERHLYGPDQKRKDDDSEAE